MNTTKTETVAYPPQYLHVTECQSGQTWIAPIGPRKQLDIDRLLSEWVKSEFCGELRVDGTDRAGLGEYDAQILTDGRPPDSVVVWDSCCFWLRSA
jgi:hypothetical protein